jgi:hypothetical protein
MTDALNPIPIPDVRKGQGDVTLSREEFARRPLERFDDPAFEALRNEVERIIEAVERVRGIQEKPAHPKGRIWICQSRV